MGNMETQKVTKKYFKLFGYCSYKEDSQTGGDYLALTINLFFSINVLLVYAESVDYVFRHWENQAAALFAVLQFVAFVDIGGAHFVLSSRKKETFRFFKHCQSLVDESMLS